MYKDYSCFETFKKQKKIKQHLLDSRLELDRCFFSLSLPKRRSIMNVWFLHCILSWLDEGLVSCKWQTEKRIVSLTVQCALAMIYSKQSTWSISSSDSSLAIGANIFQFCPSGVSSMGWLNDENFEHLQQRGIRMSIKIVRRFTRVVSDWRLWLFIRT